jgi:hypothetical protein
MPRNDFDRRDESFERRSRPRVVPESIQAAVAGAVTGVIGFDNTLVIARHFDALPPTVVIEVEPAGRRSDAERRRSYARRGTLPLDECGRSDDSTSAEHEHRRCDLRQCRKPDNERDDDDRNRDGDPARA